MIRWLGLILLVLSIHPPGFAGPDRSSGRAHAGLAAWGVSASDVEPRARDWSVDVYDDDDQDDSAPAQREARSGSDDDVLCTAIDFGIRSGDARLALSPDAEGALGPARGHSPDTERPPRAA